MKIQKISNNLPRTNNLQQQQQNIKTNSNGTTPISNADNLMFTGAKIDVVKRVILKPAAQNLDEAMTVGIKKLNVSSEIVAARLTPKIEAGAYTQTLMAKINATSERIKTLEETIATQVKPARVRNAEDDLSFYYRWDDDAQEKMHTDAALKARKAERDKYIWGTKWMSDGDEKYYEKMQPYWDGHARYMRVKSDLENIRQIIADHNSSRAAQSETLAALKREKESYVAQLTSAHLGDYVNQTVNQRGSIQERIAGYSDVKKQITDKFVMPLLASQKDLTVSLPNAVVLYGATGVGKTEILRGIEQECKNVAAIVHFPMDTPINKFQDTMRSLLSQARTRYNNEQKRTILLIDEAEKYMCMSRSKANRLAAGFETDDFDILEQFGNKDSENITFLKSLLDRISEIPKEGGLQTQSATSLFITTNYPHLIDQDLMRRKGKFMPIAVHPAKDSNLKAVIQHYFKQNSDLLEQIKLLAPQNNFAEIIRGQIRFSNKAKEVLMEKRNNGTINNMHIDYELSDWPNLERSIRFMNPSDKRGAFSNVEIKEMISTAFERYLENPTQPMYKYFFQVKDETVRDITPLRYSKFKTIYSMVNDKINGEEVEKETKNFIDLIRAYQNGELSEDACKALEKRMEHIKEELERLDKLRKQGIAFTDGEQAQYETFKKYFDMWED